ncbi:MAG: hypothetical protein JSR85_05755 [Proteobacteria bacterium]|nr:hypothetical protein [Pseudomonadota bacterium]
MLYKFLKFCVMIIVLSVVSNNVFAMDDYLDEEAVDFRRPLLREADSDVLVVAPPALLNDDPNHPTRVAINRLLERILGENTHLISDSRPQVQSAIVIYTPRDERAVSLGPIPWDDSALFLREFDERMFLNPRSKKTIVMQILGALEGPAGAIALTPFVMGISANLITFIPPGGNADLGIAITGMLLAAPAVMRQMYDRLGKIGHYFWDEERGLTPSRADKKPHTLKFEKECCGSCSFSVLKLGTVFSLFNATLRSLPVGLLFWEILRFSPVPRDWLIGPLVLLYFEKTYEESQRVVHSAAKQSWTREVHMMHEKKEILKQRLKEMKWRINSKGSDELVNWLFDEIEREKDKLREDKASPSGRNREHVSILSLFLTQRIAADIYEDAVRQVTGRRGHVQDTELLEAAQTLAASSPEKMIRLIGDLDQRADKTRARAFLENSALFSQGVATPGRFLVVLWAIQNILIYSGVDADTAFYAATGVGVIDVLCRAITEWDMQKETFLSFRRFGSRSMDFWPVRWIGTGISFVVSLVFTLPPFAIIYKLLGDSVPSYIKILFSVATAPSEFSSFFDFFSRKYKNVITGMATLHITTIKQKRAFLNQKFEELSEAIDGFDQTTTEGAYHLMERGL